MKRIYLGIIIFGLFCFSNFAFAISPSPEGQELGFSYKYGPAIIEMGSVNFTIEQGYSVLKLITPNVAGPESNVDGFLSVIVTPDTNSKPLYATYVKSGYFENTTITVDDLKTIFSSDLNNSQSPPVLLTDKEKNHTIITISNEKENTITYYAFIHGKQGFTTLAYEINNTSVVTSEYTKFINLLNKISYKKGEEYTDFDSSKDLKCDKSFVTFLTEYYKENNTNSIVNVSSLANKLQSLNTPNVIPNSETTSQNANTETYVEKNTSSVSSDPWLLTLGFVTLFINYFKWNKKDINERKLHDKKASEGTT